MDIRTSLGLPANTLAILCDMDGVLIDSLGFDLANCGRILNKVTGIDHSFTRDVLRDGFALSPDDFWRYLAAKAQLKLEETQIRALIELFETERCNQAFPILPGVLSLIEASRKGGLKLAVVSNTPVADVERILRNCGLGGLFDAVLGNDGGESRKKPFPDTYLQAAKLLDVGIADCVVIEDSLIGAEAGHRAGAFVIGVSTGGTSRIDLENSRFCQVCRHSLDADLLNSQT